MGSVIGDGGGGYKTFFSKTTGCNRFHHGHAHKITQQDMLH